MGVEDEAEPDGCSPFGRPLCKAVAGAASIIAASASRSDGDRLVPDNLERGKVTRVLVQPLASIRGRAFAPARLFGTHLLRDALYASRRVGPGTV